MGSMGQGDSACQLIGSGFLQEADKTFLENTRAPRVFRNRTGKRPPMATPTYGSWALCPSPNHAGGLEKHPIAEREHRLICRYGERQGKRLLTSEAGGYGRGVRERNSVILQKPHRFYDQGLLDFRPPPISDLAVLLRDYSCPMTPPT